MYEGKTADYYTEVVISFSVKHYLRQLSVPYYVLCPSTPLLSSHLPVMAAKLLKLLDLVIPTS